MLDPEYFLLFYVLAYILFCFFFIFTLKVRLSSLKFFTVTFVITVSAICGLRSQYVGTDTYTFYNLTRLMNASGSFLWAKDYFYYSLTRLGCAIQGFQLSVLIPSVVTSVFLGWSLYRLVNISFKEVASRSYFMTRTVSLLLIFILMLSSSDFLMQIANQTRQIMGLAFFLFAFSFYLEKRIALFLVFSLIGYFSHHSLILLFLSLFVVHFVKKERTYFIILSICCLLSFSGLSGHILGGLGIGVSEDSIYSKALNSTLSLYVKTFITISLGFFVYYLNKKVPVENRGFESTLINIYMMLSSLSMLYISFAEASNRIQRYEGVIFPIIFVLLIRKLKVNALHIVLVILFSILYFSFMMNYYSTLKTLGFYSSQIKVI